MNKNPIGKRLIRDKLMILKQMPRYKNSKLTLSLKNFQLTSKLAEIDLFQSGGK